MNNKKLVRTQKKLEKLEVKRDKLLHDVKWDNWLKLQDQLRGR